MNCIFCDIIDNKISSLKVWENDSFLAFLDITPINPGHILVIPKEHYEDVYEMPDQLYTDLFAIIKRLSPILKKVTLAKRIGLIIEGFGVSHVHVHLVPVNNGNELNPERAHKMSDEELKKIQQSIKTAFEAI